LKASIFIKSVISSLLFYSGIVNREISKQYRNECFVVLMYHRVVPASHKIQAGMYVTPETFDIHLQYLKKVFEVISLSELLQNFKSGSIGSFKKPVCVLTFDDGWLDFYENAYPLLQKYHLPATVFLPTKFIGSQKKFWTDRFSEILFQRQATCVAYECNSDSSKIVLSLLDLPGLFDDQLENGIAKLKNYPKIIIDEILLELAKVCGVENDKSDRDFLDWSEIVEMKQSGLVSFGSHTVNHQILTTLDDKAVTKELVDSKNELLRRNVVDGSCISFCYPNGNFTKKIAGLVSASGYDIAVTTCGGWNCAFTDQFLLNRVGIHNDMTSTTALFACKIAGLI